MSTYGISFKDKAQQELIRVIKEDWTRSPIVVAYGDAGTGKNFAALAAGFEALDQKIYAELKYTRDPAQTGDTQIGFLPGDLKDKTDEFFAPLYDTIESIARYRDHDTKSRTSASRGDMKARAKTIDLTTARGRTFDNTLLIVDECQNLSLETLQTIATRAGSYSKIVFLGSFNQIDNPKIRKQKISDFQLFVEHIDVLEEFLGLKIPVIHLTETKRSPFCVAVDKGFEALKDFRDHHDTITQPKKLLVRVLDENGELADEQEVPVPRLGNGVSIIETTVETKQKKKKFNLFKKTSS